MISGMMIPWKTSTKRKYMSLCIQNMALGVRTGMVYVLGRASRVVIINVNRFHKNRHL